MPSLWESAFEIAKFFAIIAFAGVAFTHLARHGFAPFGFRFSVRRRRVALFILALLAVAIKVGEDVIEGETTRVDESILLFIKAHVPAVSIPFFEAVTLTGAGTFLAPVVVGAGAFLVWARRYSEAILVMGSSGLGALAIWTLKRAVNRDRPALWEIRWYWGSSFPSGHTLASACLATALFICAARTYRQRRNVRVGIFVSLSAWVIAVGVSRLVLGVHWPSDVLAATCLGISIPFLVEAMIVRWSRRC